MSNGYVVVGGGVAADVEFVPQTMPSVARPNNVIAPWWTDIDLSQAAPSGLTGARIDILTDGSDDWLVIDYQDVATFGSCTPGPCDLHDFQIWIGLLGDADPGEDVTMAHGDLGVGSSDGLNAGAENRDGTSGVNMSPLPSDNTDWTINTSPPTPGGFVQITYDALGEEGGRVRAPGEDDQRSDARDDDRTRDIDGHLTGAGGRAVRHSRAARPSVRLSVGPAPRG